MRKKIKELMNKEEGFTLVELLAVIVILGIIVAIAIPSIGGIIQKAETNANTAEEALIIDAARVYFTAEQPAADTVTVADLVTDGYLEQRGEDAIQGGTVTRVQAASGTYSYTFN